MMTVAVTMQGALKYVIKNLLQSSFLQGESLQMALRVDPSASGYQSGSCAASGI